MKKRKGGLAIESIGLIVLMIVTIAIILFAFIHYFVQSRETLNKNSNSVSKEISSVISGISNYVSQGKGFTLVPNSQSSPSSSAPQAQSQGSSSTSSTSSIPVPPTP